jgi:hypothetical protein
MKTESEKYDMVINVLRNSKPDLNSSFEIEKEVLRRISEDRSLKFIIADALEFLFSWIYIGWVRRFLITASVCLVIVFVWQQGVILKEINHLSRQVTITDKEPGFDPSVTLEKRILTYKLGGLNISSKSGKMTEKQIIQLLDSVNKLQIKYRDLMNLIEEDPDLKKIIEKKLLENSRRKTNM